MRRELFRKAIKADDKFVEAYRLLATDYARMDSMMTAIEILKPIAANPELDYYSEVIIDISDYYYLDGKYQEAIDALNALSDARFFQQKDELIKKNEEAIEMLNNPHDINPKNLRQINTPFDDYFPSITADGMMLSTTVLFPTENEYGFARN
jgi:tetratricopeptide (TPR) repeat protein